MQMGMEPAIAEPIAWTVEATDLPKHDAPRPVHAQRWNKRNGKKQDKYKDYTLNY